MLSHRRGFPRRPRVHARGERHRPGFRPARHADDGSRPDRAGSLGARPGTRPVTAPRTLREPSVLVDGGLISPEELGDIEQVAARYAVAISPAMAGLIDPSDPTDPIARQFVPVAAELVTMPEERTDPIGDSAHSPVEGIVHRYPDRVLLKAVHVCLVYCRFCFRREVVGPRGLGN